MSLSAVGAALDDLFTFHAGFHAWRPVAGEPVVIYGAGGFARAVREAVCSAGGRVLYALDQRADAIRSLAGTPVHPPGLEPTALGERAVITAVVGVFNRDADPAHIEHTLRALGYGRVVSAPELYESFAPELGTRFWLAARARYEPHRDAIEAVDNLWSDAPSRELYRSLLRYRLRWSASDAPSKSESAQYFPIDVPRPHAIMTLVDCGAFIGDTLAEVAGLGLSIEAAYAFEPDLPNFRRLASYGREFAAVTGAGVALWPCAVASTSGPLRFHSDGGETGRLASDGGDVVTAVALDDVLPSAAVTDLKMDIEGAELDALHGAERTIRRTRPRLAICVYHRAEHLWEIPLFVRDLGLGYDFYLRSHGRYGFDVVMYAVPQAAS